MVDLLIDRIRLWLGIHECNDRSQILLAIISGYKPMKCCVETYHEMNREIAKLEREYVEALMREAIERATKAC
jgi:hypothetical protein